MVGEMADGCNTICLFVHYSVFISARAFNIFGIQYIYIAFMSAAEYILPSANLHLCIGPKAGNTFCYVIDVKGQSQWKGKEKEKTN